MVSRRLQERAAGSHRLRPPVRASDVRGVAASRPRLLSAIAGRRRGREWVDEHRSHELLGSRADERARPGPLDGIRSDGVLAAGADPGQVRKSARRGVERAPAELREPSVRPRRHGARGSAVPPGSSLSLADDRRGRRPAGGETGRGSPVFQDLLSPGQRVAGVRRGCRYESRHRALAAVLRGDHAGSGRTARRCARRRCTPRQGSAAGTRGPGRAPTPVPVVAHTGAVRAR